jgi:hypothetical protein
MAACLNATALKKYIDDNKTTACQAADESFYNDFKSKYPDGASEAAEVHQVRNVGYKIDGDDCIQTACSDLADYGCGARSACMDKLHNDFLNDSNIDAANTWNANNQDSTQIKYKDC